MPTPKRDTKRTARPIQCAAMAAVALVASGCARTSPAPAPRTATEQRFSDPPAGVPAWRAACRTNDGRAPLPICGEDSARLVGPGTPDADRARCRRLVAAAKQMPRLDPAGPDTLELVVGSDDW